jgi:hypothetical protein
MLLYIIWNKNKQFSGNYNSSVWQILLINFQSIKNLSSFFFLKKKKEKFKSKRFLHTSNAASRFDNPHERFHNIIFALSFGEAKERKTKI